MTDPVPVTPPAPPPTVFIVDDDEAVRDSLAAMVEVAGLPVEVFDSALAFLHRCPQDRPGCLVMDLRMPGMDGLALLGVVKQRHAGVRFVMLTAVTDPDHVRQAAHLKVDGYMAKPFSRQTLLDTLTKLRAAETR